MNVMNIKHYLSVAASLMVLAACSEYDPGFSGEAVDVTEGEIEQMKEYTRNFVEQFGDIDPNHTWGFGELADMEEMGTRQSEPRSNEWVTVIKGKGQQKNADGEPLYYDTWHGNEITTQPGIQDPWQGWVDFPPVPLYNNDVPIAFEKHDGAVVIPGFPVQNYYLSNQYNTESEGDPTKPVRYSETGTPENRQGQYHIKFPNHEGEFWFESEEAILQYMRDNNINETQIIPLGDVADFNTLTDAEVADVYAAFSEEWHGTNPDIDLKSYYIQQIWKGTAAYEGTTQNGDKVTVVGGEKMDYLVAYGEDNSAGDTEHFYNFNNSNIAHGDKSMMLVFDSSTKNFAYKTSFSEDPSGQGVIMWDHYRLIELHGNYYVGFDFESFGADEHNIPRDYVYNDWIVKIIPGEGTINEPDERVRSLKRRVMCEDLGTTDDFDFNDLVFDVEYTREEMKVDGEWVPKNSDGKWTATITLQASGGTLPIFIQNFDGTEYNVHEYMGGTTAGRLYNPINVGIGVIRDAKALPTCQVTSTNPDDIVIKVYSPDAEHRYADKNLTLPSVKGAQKFGDNLAPQKICVPVNVRWLREYQQIEWAYPYFKEWVESENGAAGFGNEHDWTTEGIQEGYLY